MLTRMGEKKTKIKKTVFKGIPVTTLIKGKMLQ